MTCFGSIIKGEKVTRGQKAFSSPLHHGVAEDGNVLAGRQDPVLVDVSPNYLGVIEGQPVALWVQSSHHHESLFVLKIK
jgi:hypothetical protein